MMPGPRVHSFTSASEFLDYLSPAAPTWAGEPGRWCYRGHGDASWRLLPRLFRPKPGEASCGTRMSLFLAEFAMLARFFIRMDRKGLPIPFDGMKLREIFPPVGGQTKGDIETWPQDVVLPLMALAQHHGIPTRALDWTRSSFVASYFAAKDHLAEIEKGNEPDGLAVWAWCYRDFEVVPSSGYLKEAKAEGRQRIHGRFRDSDGWTISPVIVPGAGNPNLHAQQGMFSVLRNQSRALGVEVIPKPHDEIALEVQTGSQYPAHPPVYPIVRLELVGSEARRLLRLLFLMGVDASLVWPGIEGAARSVIEQADWDDEVTS